MKSDLKEKFHSRGFTLAQVAARLSVDKATVTRWAQKRIPAERAGAVADITGIPLYELRPDIWTVPVVSASEAAAE